MDYLKVYNFKKISGTQQEISEISQLKLKFLNTEQCQRTEDRAETIKLFYKQLMYLVTRTNSI